MERDNDTHAITAAHFGLEFSLFTLGNFLCENCYRQSEKTSKTKTKWVFYLATNGKIYEKYTNGSIWLNMSYMTGIYGRHRQPDT